MKRVQILCMCLTVLASITVRADSIDDAEAKRRGVPVEVIQSENLKSQVATMQQQIADLKTQVAGLTKQVATLQTNAGKMSDELAKLRTTSPATQTATQHAVDQTVVKAKIEAEAEAGGVSTWQCWVSPKDTASRAPSYRDYIQAGSWNEAEEMFSNKHPNEKITQVEVKH